MSVMVVSPCNNDFVAAWSFGPRMSRYIGRAACYCNAAEYTAQRCLPCVCPLLLLMSACVRDRRGRGAALLRRRLSGAFPPGGRHRRHGDRAERRAPAEPHRAARRSAPAQEIHVDGSAADRALARHLAAARPRFATALPVRRRSRALAAALRLAHDRRLGDLPCREDGAARERDGAEEPALARDAGIRDAAGLDGRDAVRLRRRSSLPDRRSDAPLRSARGLDARRQDRQPQREDRRRARRRRGAGWRQRTTPGHAGVPEVHAAAPAGSLPAAAAASADRLGRRPDVARRPVGTRHRCSCIPTGR